MCVLLRELSFLVHGPPNPPTEACVIHMSQCWPRAGGRVAMTNYYSDASVGLSVAHLEHLIYFDPKFWRTKFSEREVDTKQNLFRQQKSTANLVALVLSVTLRFCCPPALTPLCFKVLSCSRMLSQLTITYAYDSALLFLLF